MSLPQGDRKHLNVQLWERVHRNDDAEREEREEAEAGVGFNRCGFIM